MKKIIAIINTLFIIISCQTEAPQQNDSEKNNDSKESKVPVVASNIISCNGIGELQFSMSLKEIESKFGKSQIQHDTIFADTEDALIGIVKQNLLSTKVTTPYGEIRIKWKNHSPKQGIEILTTRSQGFQFENGVKVGIPLRKLIDINQDHFRFLGFGWEFSGNFPQEGSKGKHFSQYPCFYGYLKFNDESTYQPVEKFLGDSMFSTSDKDLPLDQIILFEINIKSKK